MRAGKSEVCVQGHKVKPYVRSRPGTGENMSRVPTPCNMSARKVDARRRVESQLRNSQWKRCASVRAMAKGTAKFLQVLEDPEKALHTQWLRRLVASPARQGARAGCPLAEPALWTTFRPRRPCTGLANDTAGQARRAQRVGKLGGRAWSQLWLPYAGPPDPNPVGPLGACPPMLSALTRIPKSVAVSDSIFCTTQSALKLLGCARGAQHSARRSAAPRQSCARRATVSVCRRGSGGCARL